MCEGKRWVLYGFWTCLHIGWSLDKNSFMLDMKTFLYKPVSFLPCQVKCNGPKSLNPCVLENEVVILSSGRLSQWKQPITEGRQSVCLKKAALPADGFSSVASLCPISACSHFPCKPKVTWAPGIPTLGPSRFVTRFASALVACSSAAGPCTELKALCTCGESLWEKMLWDWKFRDEEDLQASSHWKEFVFLQNISL